MNLDDPWSGPRAYLLAVCLITAASTAWAQQPIERSPSPMGARLYIISPEDGETVTNPVTVRFGLSGMGVVPAGIRHPEAGHHHLILDAELPPPDRPIPADDHYRHFGRGQTETTLELSPGRHSLQLLLGDQDHVPHDPPLVSKKIHITVK